MVEGKDQSSTRCFRPATSLLKESVRYLPDPHSQPAVFSLASRSRAISAKTFGSDDPLAVSSVTRSSGDSVAKSSGLTYNQDVLIHLFHLLKESGKR